MKWLNLCPFNCRSEMHETTVTVRYGLMLEAYLKSSQDHLMILSKQQDILVKLKAFSEIAKNPNVSLPPEKAQDYIHSIYIDEWMIILLNYEFT